MSRRARVVDWLLRLTARWPLRLLHSLGSLIGTLADLIPNDARHIARVNIELCYPELPLAAKKKLVRAALRETAKSAAELGVVWRRPVPAVLALVRGVEDEAMFHEAFSEGRGLLVIAPHLGAWEVLQAWIAQHVPSNALYRPPRQAGFEALITEARSRTGVKFWPARGSGVRALSRALRNGEAIGILPDQQPPEEGVFVPFFGVPAKTMTLFGKLAGRSGAPVIIGWAERLPDGAGYRIHWQRADPAIADPDPELAATALNRTVEHAARVRPEQYQWAYRRFSRQPPGTRNPYRKYRSAGGWVTAERPPGGR